jgi:hypothetical protein
MKRRTKRREVPMIVGTMLSICVAVGDDATAKPPAPAQRFEIRKAVQWLFGKRPSAAKEATAPAGQGADDLSDARIELRCKNSVFGDPTLRASGMTIRVLGGIVYLEGTAATRLQRVRAEQLAQKTPGVTRVENHLRVADADAGDPLPVPAAPPAEPFESVKAVEHAAPTKDHPSDVVVSRPKTLAPNGDEPTVTTYTIRRTPSPGSELQPAAAKATATPTKKGGGRLVPWNESPANPQSSWLDALGITPAASPLRNDIPTARPVAVDPLDRAVQKALANSPHADALTFERQGGDIVLKGNAPPAALFSVAQEVGKLPGVATVSIGSGAKRQSPSTSAIE